MSLLMLRPTVSNHPDAKLYGRLFNAGRAVLEDDFWYDSPRDSVLSPKLISERRWNSKQNPFGAVSSPRTGTPISERGGPVTDPTKGVGDAISSDREALQHVAKSGVTADKEMTKPVGRAALCHDQGLR